MFIFGLFLTIIAISGSFCGNIPPKLTGKIVGGRSAKLGEHPYQGSLQSYGSHFCGLSIIAPLWAVTASHCVQGAKAADLQVRVGFIKLDSRDGQTVNVQRIIMHPRYNTANQDNDIAILKLATPLTFNNNVKAIQLCDTDPLNKISAIVSGWGLTHEKGSSVSSTLQTVGIPVQDRKECNISYGGQITANMICALAPGKDSCQGDSGGPLVVNGKLCGVVSFGYGCARPGVAGVYANVCKYKSWISQTMLT